MNSDVSSVATKGGSLPASGGEGTAELGDKPRLTEFQRQFVEMFVHFATALSLPRSIGEIYGFLLATAAPCSLDDVTDSLGISRGSANHGLRWLRSAGAIRGVYLPGVRKEHFTAEMELRKLAASVLRDRVEPHLDRGREWLDSIQQQAEGTGGPFERERVEKLRQWHSALEKALPVLRLLAGKA